jgi:hypothetical protein
MAVALSCVLLNAVPYEMGAGIVHVRVGVAREAIDGPPAQPEARKINGTITHRTASVFLRMRLLILFMSRSMGEPVASSRQIFETSRAFKNLKPV